MRNILYVDKILDKEWFIQSILLSDCIDILYGCILSGQQFSRIPWREMKNEKRDECNSEKNGDEIKKTSGNVLYHVIAFLIKKGGTRTPILDLNLWAVKVPL